MLFEKGFGNTNDFQKLQCLAGFWQNSGNKYFTAPGYVPSSPTYNAENPSGNVWIKYNFNPGQAGSLTGFSLNFIQSGYKDGGIISFNKVGISVWRNGVKIYETTMPVTAAHVNNPANPITFTFPNTSQFATDGSSKVDFEIAFALVERNKSLKTGADNYCLFGTAGTAAASISATPATCIPNGAANGSLKINEFTAGERYDYTLGSTYTGSATYATATPIPPNGIITSTLPKVTEPTSYTVRIFRENCYIDQTVTLPPTFCPFSCNWPDASVAANPATCTGLNLNTDANIVLSSIVNMDKVGVSPGKTYTGPAYSGAISLNG
ncbi:MAG: hypothetical protein KDD14_25765, partial [Saprospiraceae bacterium]|nr:hypothetical protein [Saprospiraceae bacterium]